MHPLIQLRILGGVLWDTLSPLLRLATCAAIMVSPLLIAEAAYRLALRLLSNLS